MQLQKAPESSASEKSAAPAGVSIPVYLISLPSAEVRRRGAHGLRRDIGEAKRFAKSMREERKAYESGPGAPFEQALLPRHLSALEETHIVLPE